MRPVFSARCDTVLDSCDVAIRYFFNHNIDIGPGMEFAILSLSGSWNIATDTELRYHLPCGVDIYLGDIKSNFSTTNNISEKIWLTTLLRSWPWFSIKASYTLKTFAAFVTFDALKCKPKILKKISFLAFVFKGCFGTGFGVLKERELSHNMMQPHNAF